MNYYSFNEFMLLWNGFITRGWTQPSPINLFETMMQYPKGVVLEVEGEEYMISPNSQEVVKECSPEMNDFINCFAQGVMV